MKPDTMYRISLPLLACLVASCAHVTKPDGPDAAPELTEYEARQAERVILLQYLAAATAPGADPTAFQSIEADQATRLNANLSRSERLYLMRMLGLFGDEASAQALVPLLSDDDPAIRDGARRALSAIGGKTPTGSLQEGLDAMDPHDRAGTIDALAYAGATRTAPEITRSIQSEDPKLITSATLALGRLGDNDGISALIAALDSAPPELRPLFESTLLSLEPDFDLVVQMTQSGSNAAIRLAAFRQLSTLDPERAESVLQTLLDQDQWVGRDRFLSYAMIHGSNQTKDAILARLPDAPLSDQVVILAAIAESRLSRYEPEVLALLPSAEAELRVALLETLGWIGGDASFEPLYQAYLADPDDDGFALALSRLRAPSADEQILDAVRNSGELEARIAAMEVLGLRNSPGATELLNAIAVQPGEAEIRTAAFKALETIGNLESIQILSTLILVRDPQAKAAQRSLWRLSRNYGEADLLWEEIYRPAILSAADTEVLSAFVFILDGVACKPTLNYLEIVLADHQSPLRRPAISALKRWPTWEALPIWIQVASEPDASAGDIATAQRAITTELNDDGWRNAAERIDLAVEAIQAAPSAEFKQAILDCYRDPSARQTQLIQRAFKAIENDPDVGEQVIRMLDEGSA